MNDDFYPTVDFTFLKQTLDNSELIEPVFSIGSTTAYVLKGEAPIPKRILLLRESKDSQVDFIYATSIAHKAKFMGELLNWYEKNRNWKDGGYIS